MTHKRKQVSVYIAEDVWSLLHTFAKGRGETVSATVCGLIEAAVARRRNTADADRRRLLFVETGVDALLARHPDSTLRDTTYSAYNTKLRDEGMSR